MLHLGLLLVLFAAPGDEGEVEKRRQEDVSRLAPAKAAQIKVLAGETKEPAALVKKPLLRWSNPTAGSVYGEVFIWTQARRPVALASIFRWFDPYTDSNIEFVTVNESPVEAHDGEARLWSANAPDVGWSSLPVKVLPADTATTRLIQMRSLAKRFTSRLVDSRGGDATSRELRLLQQPLYRYSAPDAGVVDGALFAFVEVTDPEAWLLLEAHEHEGSMRWRYLIARMNADALETHFDGKLLHEWDKIVKPWMKRNGAYTFSVFDPNELPHTAGDKPVESP